MRVLFVSFSLNSGGAAIACRTLRKNLLKAYTNLEIDVLTYKGIYTSEGNLKPISNSKIIHYFNRSVSLLTKIKFIPVISFGIFGETDESQFRDYDLIHLHWFHRGLVSLFSFKRVSIPLIITAHDFWWHCGIFHLRQDYLKHYLRFILLPFDHLIKKVKLIFINHNNPFFVLPSDYAGFKDSLLTHSAHCYTISNIIEPQISHSINENYDVIKLISCAVNLDDPNKNTRQIIRLAKELSMVCDKPIELTLIGYSRFNLFESSEFFVLTHIPQLSHSEATRIMSQNNAFVSLSTYESQSLAAYEAFYMGLTIITYNHLPIANDTSLPSENLLIKIQEFKNIDYHKLSNDLLVNMKRRPHILMNILSSLRSHNELSVKSHYELYLKCIESNTIN